jgi:hypothetical protein
MEAERRAVVHFYRTGYPYRIHIQGYGYRYRYRYRYRYEVQHLGDSV